MKYRYPLQVSCDQYDRLPPRLAKETKPKVSVINLGNIKWATPNDRTGIIMNERDISSAVKFFSYQGSVVSYNLASPVYCTVLRDDDAVNISIKNSFTRKDVTKHCEKEI